MPDFPVVTSESYAVGTIATMGAECPAGEGCRYSGNAFNGNLAWPAANRALYIPLVVPFNCTVYKMGMWNGTTANGASVILGIYDTFGKKIVDTGTYSQAGTSTLQVVDITDTPLSAGTYYFAALCSTVTHTMFRGFSTFSSVCGTKQQDVGSTSLPATATFTDMNGSFPGIVAQYVSATW